MLQLNIKTDLMPTHYHYVDDKLDVDIIRAILI